MTNNYNTSAAAPIASADKSALSATKSAPAITTGANSTSATRAAGLRAHATEPGDDGSRTGEKATQASTALMASMGLYAPVPGGGGEYTPGTPTEIDSRGAQTPAADTGSIAPAAMPLGEGSVAACPADNAAAPGPADASVPTQSPAQSTRKSTRTKAPVVDSPIKRVARSPSKAAAKSPAKANARGGDDLSTPRQDALQAAIDNVGNRLTTAEGTIQAHETGAKADRKRAQATHESVTKQLGSLTEELAELKRAGHTSRVDIERIIAKLSRLEGTARESSGYGAIGSTERDILEAQAAELETIRNQASILADEAALTQLHFDDLMAQLAELTAACRATEEATARSAAQLSRANLRLDDAERTLAQLQRRIAELERRDSGRNAAERPGSRMGRSPFAPDADDVHGHDNRDEPPAPPGAGSVRRRTDSAGAEGRAPKVARLDNAYLSTVSSYHTERPATPAYATAEHLEHIPTHIRALHPSLRSLRMGGSTAQISIDYGRPNDPNVVIQRIGQWTAMLDPTGGIPCPTLASFPPGMPAGFRLVTFNTHEDMLLFLAAWENRPQALADIIATPVSENVTPAASSASALGIRPPGKFDDRRPGAGKDARGRRPF